MVSGATIRCRVLADRAPRPDHSPDPALPDDTRLLGRPPADGRRHLGGRVYDVDAIAATFWLPLKKLSGSYFALMATSRSKFTP